MLLAILLMERLLRVDICACIHSEVSGCCVAFWLRFVATRDNTRWNGVKFAAHIKASSRKGQISLCYKLRVSLWSFHVRFALNLYTSRHWWPILHTFTPLMLLFHYSLYSSHSTRYTIPALHCCVSVSKPYGFITTIMDWLCITSTTLFCFQFHVAVYSAFVYEVLILITYCYNFIFTI